MTKIEEIASVHLGKAGDGSVVKPYITPDHIDQTLLVAIPRQLNRDHYGINKETKMYGFDTWNAYEVSFLLNNGFPVSCMAKIIYSSESTCIVESKSLKLYLNSFNMERCGDTIEEALRYASNRISDDLSILLETNVAVSLFDDATFHESEILSPFDSFTDWDFLEDLVEVENMEFPYYNENPDIIKSYTIAPAYETIAFRSSSLRSNCRVTNQPDWGDVFILIHGDNLPTYESMLQYIVSMRKENHFHEEICECIYKRLLDKFHPVELMVGCLYTRRGGIDINPVRATSMNVLIEYAQPLMTPGIIVMKTMRQ